jgi:hypothetical protein
MLSQEYVGVLKAERLPLPGDHPDTDPSRFFFFRYVKGQISNYRSEIPRDVLKMIAAIFCQIDKAMPISVFESWIKQLDRKSVV